MAVNLPEGGGRTPLTKQQYGRGSDALASGNALISEAKYSGRRIAANLHDLHALQLQ